jgi:hypothetical protein
VNNLGICRRRRRSMGGLHDVALGTPALLLPPVGISGASFDLISSLLISSTQVTNSALRTLSREILADRGPLPVGEIGKLLQETTSITTLSSILKVMKHKCVIFAT